jgi:hypothetical protein
MTRNHVLSYVDSRVYRIAPIPEPGTAGALALGLLGLAALRRRAKGRSLSRA